MQKQTGVVMTPESCILHGQTIVRELNITMLNDDYLNLVEQLIEFKYIKGKLSESSKAINTWITQHLGSYNIKAFVLRGAVHLTWTEDGIEYTKEIPEEGGCLNLEYICDGSDEDGDYVPF